MLHKNHKGRKNILIIGGSSGIGLATAKKFAEHGHNLWIIYKGKRTETESLNLVIDKLKRDFSCEVITFNFNVMFEEKVNEFINTIVEKNIQFHVVLHAISRGNLKPLVHKEKAHLTQEDLHVTISAMGTNLHVWVTSLLSKDLIGKGSRIIALTSEGNNRYWKGYGAVALAKSTLETLVKYLSVELAPYEIRINTIHAGVTDTRSLRLLPSSEALIEFSKKRNPSGRITRAADVADVVYLLSLKEADWITGSLIHVDGGEHNV